MKFKSIALFDLGHMELRICGWVGPDTEQKINYKSKLLPPWAAWNFLCNLCYTHYVETWASLWEIREWSQMAIFHDAYIDLGEEMSWQKRMTFPFNWKVGLRNQTTTGRLVLMPSGDRIQLLYLYTTTHFNSHTHHNFISRYNCTFPLY